MTIEQITTLIGAAASIICTGAVTALAFFLKKTLTGLEEADRKNAEQIKAVEEKLNTLKADLPLVFVMRDDFVRMMNRIEDKIDQTYYKNHHGKENR